MSETLVRLRYFVRSRVGGGGGGGGGTYFTFLKSLVSTTLKIRTGSH